MTAPNLSLDYKKEIKKAANEIQDGNLLNAESICRKILTSDNRHPKALQLLELISYQAGNILLQQGKPADAAACYQRVLQINPAHVDAHNNLGSAFNEMANFEEAINCFKQATVLDPLFAAAHYNLGIGHKRLDRIEEAIVCYQKAIQLKPDFVEALYSLGIALQDQGRFSDAAICFLEALKIAPDFAEAHYNLGLAYYSQGHLEDAVVCCRKALQIKAEFPEAYNNMGLVYKDQNKLSEAITCYRTALKMRPNLAQSHYNMGVVFHLQGRYQEGLQSFKRSLDINPNYPPAQWLYLLSLPMIYKTEDDIWAHRQRFRKNLDFLVNHVSLETAEYRKLALDGIGSTTNFYLQYQGQDDLELQVIYGSFAVRVMAANYPQWIKPKSMPSRHPAERIRVGYVSSFMRAHTVGEFLMGWLENHQRTEFEIYCYHIGCQTDSMTPEFQHHCDHFYQIGPAIEQAAQKIASDNLHILIFTDIGMNAPATQLAALRLAAIQCKGWGHPVTTGLSTMDYYLSSDLMEPENAQQHYSEKLIRLPNLALAYKPPALPENPKTRKEFGIRQESFVYLTSQSLFKYLPQYDHVFADIAGRVPNAQFVFLSHSNFEVTRQFQERLADAFRSLNLCFEDFCLFLPRLNFADFLSLNLASDVLLDSFCWSGGKTTLEGITCGLPVVTCRGRFMRGRHAYAMLKMVGVEDTIAANANEYIDRAARLGLNREFYRTIRKRIEKNRCRLYNDTRCIRALEDFFRSVTRTAETVPVLPDQEKSRNRSGGVKPRSLSEPANKPQPADARIYFAKGGQLVHSSRYEDAIANYQKALACIPDYLGIQPWFMQYLHDGSRPPSSGQDFVACIYQALAACLYDTGRFEDALYAIQAAISMDPSNEKIYELKARIHADHLKAPIMAGGKIRQPEIPISRYFSGPEEKLTVVMVTHFSRKLKVNANLSPPGTGLVETTYTSVLNVFGRRVANCPKLLRYDHQQSANHDETVYQQNLEKFAENHGFDLSVHNNCGLQKIVREMLQSVTSPYLLFLEHDWEFQGPEIDITALIEVFDRYENINYVRFNKRSNIIAGFDFILEKELMVPDMDLIRTVAHSNNPFIVRVDKFRQEWLPTCLNDPICQQFDLRGQAFGIEDPLFKQHIQDVRRLGFTRAHNLWGTYVFGKINDPPRIVHLGE